MRSGRSRRRSRAASSSCSSAAASRAAAARKSGSGSLTNSERRCKRCRGGSGRRYRRAPSRCSAARTEPRRRASRKSTPQPTRTTTTRTLRRRLGCTSTPRPRRGPACLSRVACSTTSAARTTTVPRCGARPSRLLWRWPSATRSLVVALVKRSTSAPPPARRCKYSPTTLRFGGTGAPAPRLASAPRGTKNGGTT
ncbi:hypothetical protein M885DRAFT_509655 [Pelagophyceae sp. CCMP2097]|nr:hypothetical protein M885DRAFT_509655 [Pelagophyceae sp. CCMP2097]